MINTKLLENAMAGSPAIIGNERRLYYALIKFEEEVRRKEPFNNDLLDYYLKDDKGEPLDEDDKGLFVHDYTQQAVKFVDSYWKQFNAYVLLYVADSLKLPGWIQAFANGKDLTSYEVNVRTTEVRNKKTKKPLSFYISKKSETSYYWQANVKTNDGKATTVYLYRVVAESFVSWCDGHMKGNEAGKLLERLTDYHHLQIHHVYGSPFVRELNSLDSLFWVGEANHRRITVVNDDIRKHYELYQSYMKRFGCYNPFFVIELQTMDAKSYVSAVRDNKKILKHWKKNTIQLDELAG